MDGVGLVRRHFTPTVNEPGTALALAVSHTEVAVLLEKNDGSRDIERYLLADQSPVATTAVPMGTSPFGFDMAGKWIVYHKSALVRRSRPELDLLDA
jgi:hypothetical protein